MKPCYEIEDEYDAEFDKLQKLSIIHDNLKYNLESAKHLLMTAQKELDNFKKKYKDYLL